MDLLIDKDIGDWDGEISANYVRGELAKTAGEKSVRIVINSLGGNVFEGVAIFNVIRDFVRQNPAVEVSTYIQGLACSAASIVALAACNARPDSLVTVEDNSVFMIHNSWDFVIGNKTAMRESADFLERIDEMMVRVYSGRTGKPADEIRRMMDGELWLFGDEIVAEGFANALVHVNDGTDENKGGAVARAKKHFDSHLCAVAKRNKGRLSAAAKTLEIPDDFNPAKISASAENKKQGGCMKITVDELKKDNPEVFATVCADGEAAGVKKERERMTRLLAMGEKSHCMDYALECIKDGSDPANEQVIDTFMDRGAAARALDAQAADENVPPVNTPKADKDVSAKAMSDAFEKALKNGGSDYGDD